MEVRITQQNAATSAVRQAQVRLQQIGELQHQLATGLRINKPSDAPAEWGTLTANKASVQRMAVDLENISTVRQRLNQSVSTLTEAGNILTRARELGLSGPQSQHRETLAQEVDQLIKLMLSISNSAEGGIQLYSGTASHKNSFEVGSVDESGRPLKVEYVGGNHTSEVLVGANTFANMLATGDQVFQQTSRDESIYVGNTGAAQGAGTDSASGTGSLTVRHTDTVYLSGGVLPGASSADGDTIIGAAGTHVLLIEDDPIQGQVVRLNEGARFPFDASSTDLLVVGDEGEQVYVDMSAVAASFTGEISIEANGTMSIDGVTDVPIDFTTNQVLDHADSGDMTVVDTTGVRSVGTDRIEYSGTNGVFESLMQLRDDLRNADQWTSAEFVAIMDERIRDVERSHDHVIEFVGEQAVELSNLETLETRVREIQLVTQQGVIETENADVADVIVRLQTQQNHLQFIYASTASISQTSLLDFIR